MGMAVVNFFIFLLNFFITNVQQSTQNIDILSTKGKLDYNNNTKYKCTTSIDNIDELLLFPDNVKQNKTVVSNYKLFIDLREKEKKFSGFLRVEFEKNSSEILKMDIKNLKIFKVSANTNKESRTTNSNLNFFIKDNKFLVIT